MEFPILNPLPCDAGSCILSWALLFSMAPRAARCSVGLLSCTGGHPMFLCHSFPAALLCFFYGLQRRFRSLWMGAAATSIARAASPTHQRFASIDGAHGEARARRRVASAANGTRWSRSGAGLVRWSAWVGGQRPLLPWRGGR